MPRHILIVGAIVLALSRTALTVPADLSQDSIYPGDLVVVTADGASLTAVGTTPRQLAAGTRVTVTEVRGDYLGVVGEVAGEPLRGWLRREAVRFELPVPPSPAPTPLGPDDATARERLRAAGVRLEVGPAGSVIAADARSSQLAASMLDDIAALPRLTRLDLGGRPVSGGLAALARLPGLRELYLDGCSLGDSDLAAISHLASLEILSLAGSGVTGSSLAHLASLSRLTTLNLRGCAVGDGDLAALAPLTSLEVLVLAETGVRGAGLAALTPLVNLIVLNLNRCPLDGLALRKLDVMVSLRMLFLRGSMMPDEVIAHLRATIPSLCVDTRPFSAEDDERDGVRGGTT